MSGMNNMLKEDDHTEMLMLEFILELDVDHRFSQFLNEQAREDDIRLAECRKKIVQDPDANVDFEAVLETRTTVLMKFIKLVNAENELNEFMAKNTVMH